MQRELLFRGKKILLSPLYHVKPADFAAELAVFDACLYILVRRFDQPA